MEAFMYESKVTQQGLMLTDSIDGLEEQSKFQNIDRRKFYFFDNMLFTKHSPKLFVNHLFQLNGCFRNMYF